MSGGGLAPRRPGKRADFSCVNPVLAVLLGVWLAGERITVPGAAAMLTILAGVVLVALGQRGFRSRK